MRYGAQGRKLRNLKFFKHYGGYKIKGLPVSKGLDGGYSRYQRTSIGLRHIRRTHCRRLAVQRL